MKSKWILAAILAIACTFAQAQQQLPNNKSFQVIASAAQTAATVNTDGQTNNQWTSAQIIINVSAYTSGQYVPHIQGLDAFTGLWYDLLVGSAITSTGQTVLHVGRGVLAVPNVAAQAELPLTWRVQMIGTSTPSMTFSITANMGI